jgi:hypothetical protein
VARRCVCSRRLLGTKAKSGPVGFGCRSRPQEFCSWSCCRALPDDMGMDVSGVPNAPEVMAVIQEYAKKRGQAFADTESEEVAASATCAAYTVRCEHWVISLRPDGTVLRVKASRIMVHSVSADGLFCIVVRCAKRQLRSSRSDYGQSHRLQLERTVWLAAPIATMKADMSTSRWRQKATSALWWHERGRELGPNLKGNL